MNKKHFLIVMAAAAAMILATCGSKGDMGTQGPSGDYSVYLQQGMYPSASYTGSTNASVSSAFPTASSSAAIYAGVNASSGITRSFIKFDLAGLVPANAVITKCYLTLYCLYAVTDNGANTVTLHELTRNFGAATWNKYDGITDWAVSGGDYSAASAGGGVTMTANAYNEIPVTVSVVQKWLNVPSVNYGLMINCGNESAGDSSYQAINSTETTNPERRPMLKIYYTLP